MSSIGIGSTPPRGGLRLLHSGQAISTSAPKQPPSGPRSPDQLTASLRSGIEQALAEDRTVLVLRIRHRALPRRSGEHGARNQVADEIYQRLHSVDTTLTAISLSETEIEAFVPSLRRRSEGEELVDQLIEALSPPLDIDGLPHYLSPTIGAALLDQENPDADLLLAASSLALEETDNAHRGVMFHPYQRVRHSRSVEIEKELRAAVLDNSTSVALQPAVSLQTGEIRAVEAFARWTRPGKGPVLALDLVQIAEEIGALHQLSRQVLARALVQTLDWQERELIGDVTLWVNTSPTEVLHPEFSNKIVDAIKVSQRIKIGIELSPSPPSSEKYVNGIIRSLVALGARAAIGDFGAGYVDLSVAHQLPFDSVKLDRSLIRQIVGNEQAADMVSVLIDLAHKLNMEVTAQGVETQEQADLLIQMGCPIGQGFLFARPMDHPNMDNYLKNRQPISE